MRTLLLAPVMALLGLVLSAIVALSALGLSGLYRCPGED